MCACSQSLQSCATLLRLHGRQPSMFLYPWDSLSNNTGVGGNEILQGIFPIQGSNPCLLHLLHCRQILYQQASDGEAQGTI